MDETEIRMIADELAAQRANARHEVPSLPPSPAAPPIIGCPKPHKGFSFHDRVARDKPAMIRLGLAAAWLAFVLLAFGMGWMLGSVLQPCFWRLWLKHTTFPSCEMNRPSQAEIEAKYRRMVDDVAKQVQQVNVEHERAIEKIKADAARHKILQDAADDLERTINFFEHRKSP